MHKQHICYFVSSYVISHIHRIGPQSIESTCFEHIWQNIVCVDMFGAFWWPEFAAPRKAVQIRVSRAGFWLISMQCFENEAS